MTMGRASAPLLGSTPTSTKMNKVTMSAHAGEDRDVGDKYAVGSFAPLAGSVPAPSAVGVLGQAIPSKLECDYDMNPTVLYQAIEAIQWEYAVSLFKPRPSSSKVVSCAAEAATWVVRKETNGKLRWRLLPLHAGVIFGAPLALIELLLAEYPAASHCKDDQGMLPLHLAFRNESSFEIIEELLTAHPQAIFVKDRKGRTPLNCGTRSISSSNSVSSNSQCGDGSRTFKSVVTVLDLFTQISLSGEKQKVASESRSVLEARLGQLQDTHLQTLTTLRKEWQTKSEETRRNQTMLNAENAVLKQKLQEQEIEITLAKITEKELAEKVRSLSTALKQTTNKDVATSQLEDMKKTNQTLRLMIEEFVQQQKAYHSQFHLLTGNYENSMQERQQIMNVYSKESSAQMENEAAVVGTFKKWLEERENKLQRNEFKFALQEEKKVEDVLDCIERSSPTHPVPYHLITDCTTPTSAVESSSPDEPAVIDLSHVASPKEGPE
jgi:hypothetical protein